jgi:hypothetical protein
MLIAAAAAAAATGAVRNNSVLGHTNDADVAMSAAAIAALTQVRLITPCLSMSHDWGFITRERFMSVS